jgi:hypothetical protein
MSTTFPRDRLRRTEPGRMSASSSEPISPAVSGVAGTCSVTASDWASRSASVGQGRALPMLSLGAMSWYTTCIPIVSASTDTWEPMWPYPTMPSVFPRTSWASLAVFSHPPRLACAAFSGIPRMRRITSPITSSATERVLE